MATQQFTLPETEAQASTVHEQLTKAVGTNKKRTKKWKTLNSVLPTLGFEYVEGEKIFEDYKKQTAAKYAIMKASPNLARYDVDTALADLFIQAKEARQYGRVSDLFNVSFEKGAEKVGWAKELPSDVVSRLMTFLLNARKLHIKFSEFRPNPVDPSTEGKLTKAIDAYTGISPHAEPDEVFLAMDQRLVTNMMYRMKHGMKADWDDSDVEMEDADSAEAAMTQVANKAEEAKAKATSRDKGMAAGLKKLSMD